jgi:peptide/nickel transport system ATP-binding protein
MKGLDVQGLHVEFARGGARYDAVAGIDLAVAPGETLALVGESGSGKSVTALAIMRLLPEEGATARATRLHLDGEALLELPERAMRRIRGRRISMVFQEPMTSLNPVLTVGEQIVEALREHIPMSRGKAWDQAVALLERVRIPDAAAKARDYPHRLSGGMRQRVVIAIALACRPDILIADEPTTALDVTIQAQVLRLIRELQRELGTGVLLITHNLGVVAQTADRVAVMYAGLVVETAPVRDLFRAPLHPYTRGLVAALPRAEDDGPLSEMPGAVPDPRHRPPGCPFAPRCPLAMPRCEAERPVLETLAPGHRVACWVAAA